MAVSARLAGDRSAVARAIGMARDFARRAQLSPGDADRLAVIVEEWVANLVEHAGLAPGSRVGLRLERMGAVVRLTASDAGRPFDPRTPAFEGPDLERGGGAGLELIRAWSRITGYGRRGGRNRLTLEMPVTSA